LSLHRYFARTGEYSELDCPESAVIEMLDRPRSAQGGLSILMFMLVARSATDCQCFNKSVHVTAMQVLYDRSDLSTDPDNFGELIPLVHEFSVGEEIPRISFPDGIVLGREHLPCIAWQIPREE
jgi:hypothetical protein